MRTKLADALVAWASGWLSTGMRLYWMRHRSLLAYYLHGAATVPIRISGRVGVPLALRLDKEAAATRMIEECWWG